MEEVEHPLLATEINGEGGPTIVPSARIEVCEYRAGLTTLGFILPALAGCHSSDRRPAKTASARRAFDSGPSAASQGRTAFATISTARPRPTRPGTVSAAINELVVSDSGRKRLSARNSNLETRKRPWPRRGLVSIFALSVSLWPRRPRGLSFLKPSRKAAVSPFSAKRAASRAAPSRRRARLLAGRPAAR